MQEFTISGLSESLGRSLSDLRGLASGFTAELSEAAKAMRGMDGDAKKLSRSLSSSLRSAFDKAVFGGERLGDVFRDLASTVAGRALDAALRPVSNALSGGVTSVFSGLGTGLFSALGFAKGGVFTAGDVQAFANGGVVSGPTLFGMKSGLGVMGEAGPEAVMPLTRGPDGRLGVQAQGGGAGGSPIVINISTPDVAGFQRSRGQISAQLARAVRRGQGSL